jgi:hypothetical protein
MRSRRQKPPREGMSLRANQRLAWQSPISTYHFRHLVFCCITFIRRRSRRQKPPREGMSLRANQRLAWQSLEALHVGGERRSQQRGAIKAPPRRGQRSLFRLCEERSLRRGNLSKPSTWVESVDIRSTAGSARGAEGSRKGMSPTNG